MTAADLQAQELASLLEDEELRAQAKRLSDTIQNAVGRLRHLLFELRPPSLERDGIAAALRSYAAALDGPEVVVRDALAFEPPADLGAVVFRIAQEAITNARKHARASRVIVTLSSEQDGLRLRVDDDGDGFDVAVADDPDPGHIGLTAMIERAELAGGWLRIDSRRGVGTAVDAWLPDGSEALWAGRPNLVPTTRGS
jgi:signal transduction histidine kinase